MSLDPEKSFLRDHPEGCSLAVRVQPGAKRTAITGVHGEGTESRLKIALQAPPIEGRANEALVAFLADLFNLPKACVVISHGHTGRSKLVILHGLRTSEALRDLVASGRTHPSR